MDLDVAKDLPPALLTAADVELRHTGQAQGSALLSGGRETSQSMGT